MIIPGTSIEFKWRQKDAMNADSIIAAIDAEIAKLHQARALLSEDTGASSKGKQSRPAKPQKTAKRVLSPEARKRIADAQRKRWAVSRKVKNAGTKAVAKAEKKTAVKKNTAEKKANRSSPKTATRVKAKKAVSKKSAPIKTEAPNQLPLPS